MRVPLHRILQVAAAADALVRSARRIVDFTRATVGKVVLKPQAAGPVAIWSGEPKRPSIEHDNAHDDP
jgi:hypothetical protein